MTSGEEIHIDESDFGALQKAMAKSKFQSMTNKVQSDPKAAKVPASL